MKTLRELLKTIFAPVVAFFVAAVSPDEVIALMATITGIFTLVPLIVEPISNYFNTQGWATRGIVLVVAALFTHLSWWLELGFEGLQVIHTILISAGITVAAWGYVSIEQVKSALRFLFEYLKD